MNNMAGRCYVGLEKVTRSRHVTIWGHLRRPPDELKAFTMYVAGEEQHLWAAAMLCPCGCGDVIELNLLKQASPCWSVRLHADGSVSLVPSVWRSKGCRSHFLVRHGRIGWCRSESYSSPT